MCSSDNIPAKHTIKQILYLLNLNDNTSLEEVLCTLYTLIFIVNDNEIRITVSDYAHKLRAKHPSSEYSSAHYATLFAFNLSPLLNKKILPKSKLFMPESEFIKYKEIPTTKNDSSCYAENMGFIYTLEAFEYFLPTDIACLFKNTYFNSLKLKNHTGMLRNIDTIKLASIRCIISAFDFLEDKHLTNSLRLTLDLKDLTPLMLLHLVKSERVKIELLNIIKLVK